MSNLNSNNATDCIKNFRKTRFWLEMAIFFNASDLLNLADLGVMAEEQCIHSDPWRSLAPSRYKKMSYCRQHCFLYRYGAENAMLRGVVSRFSCGLVRSD